MRKLTVAIAAFGITAMALGSATPSTAEIRHPTPVSLKHIELTAPMNVTGFDATNAERAGNAIKRVGSTQVLYNKATGKEIARIGGRTISPANTVRGNCGSSFLTLTYVSGAKYIITTGFDLNRTAVGFSWAFNVRADDNRGVYNFDWDDAGAIFPSRRWVRSVTDYTDHRGDTHVGRVTKGIAYVPNGVICTSGYPSDAIYIPR